MDARVTEFRVKLNNLAEECHKFCFLSRAKEFQLEATEKLENLKKEARSLKQEIIAERDEESANVMLSFEASIEAMINELKMWISFKEDDPSAAWDYLINAQGAVRTSMQAHSISGHLDDYINRLHLLEKFLFPPQVFFSTGMVIEKGYCSICGQEYGECNHLKGRAYMGEMCVQVIRDVKKLNEISVVSEPASKYCRIISFTDKGITRDFLSWRPIPKGSD